MLLQKYSINDWLNPIIYWLWINSQHHVLQLHTNANSSNKVDQNSLILAYLHTNTRSIVILNHLLLNFMSLFQFCPHLIIDILTLRVKLVIIYQIQHSGKTRSESPFSRFLFLFLPPPCPPTQNWPTYFLIACLF